MKIIIKYIKTLLVMAVILGILFALGTLFSYGLMKHPIPTIIGALMIAAGFVTWAESE